MPGGTLTGITRSGVLAAGAVFFAAGYLWFAASAQRPLVLLPAFVLAGLGIGCGETAQARSSPAWHLASSAARPSACSSPSSPPGT
jgi:hypothetical protein